MNGQADFGTLVGQWATDIARPALQGRIIAACAVKDGIVVYYRTTNGGVCVQKLDMITIPS